MQCVLYNEFITHKTPIRCKSHNIHTNWRKQNFSCVAYLRTYVHRTSQTMHTGHTGVATCSMGEMHNKRAAVKFRNKPPTPNPKYHWLCKFQTQKHINPSPILMLSLLHAFNDIRYNFRRQNDSLLWSYVCLLLMSNSLHGSWLHLACQPSPCHDDHLKANIGSCDANKTLTVYLNAVSQVAAGWRCQDMLRDEIKGCSILSTDI